MERITSRKNPHIQYWRKLSSSASFRRECREFICDGEKLYREALSAGFAVTAVILSDAAQLLPEPDCPVYQLPSELLDYISPVKTTQGMLFTCRIPEKSAVPYGNRFVVLEHVQDPGNVGAVLRTSRAMGYDGVLLLDGCADLYSEKTLRASMGAAFRQSVTEISYEQLEELKASGISLYGAALRLDSLDVRTVDYSRFALCIGSEGRGLSEKLLDMCNATVVIPMEKDCESLNAAMAAGIFMWESVRGTICQN